MKRSKVMVWIILALFAVVGAGHGAITGNWVMDETSGSNVPDVYGNPGTLSGNYNWMEGDDAGLGYDYALTFGGDTGRLDIPNANWEGEYYSVQADTQFTLTWDLKVMAPEGYTMDPAISKGEGIIAFTDTAFGYWASGGTTNPTHLRSAKELIMTPEGYLETQVMSVGAGTGTGTTDIRDGYWHDVKVVWTIDTTDGAADSVAVYLDSVLEFSITGVDLTVNDVSTDRDDNMDNWNAPGLVIGSLENELSTRADYFASFGGSIDDVKVTFAFSSPPEPEQTGPYVVYSFNELTGASDVLTDGTLVTAVNCADADDVMVNGITFVGAGAGDLTGFDAPQGGTLVANDWGDTSIFAGDVGTTDVFDGLFNSVVYQSSTPKTEIRLTLDGLTPDQDYRLQLFSGETRTGVLHDFKVKMRGIESFRCKIGDDGLGDHPNTPPKAARVDVYFTATDTTERVSFISADGGASINQFRAYALHEVDPVLGCGNWGYFENDLNWDCTIDLQDYAIVASQWLASTGFDDLTSLISQWLMSSDPADADGEVVPDQYTPIRDGLSNCFNKFEAGGTARVAFLGGSITYNPGWRDYVGDYLTDMFPDTTFDFINGGIGSTGSTAGAFRIMRDIFASGPVDLLFVEFAVNDLNHQRSSQDKIRAMEGIVRHARLLNPNIDIVMMFFADAGSVTADMYQVIADQESVAARYGVPTIHLSEEVDDLITAGDLTWTTFGGKHPGPIGQQIYLNAIKRLLHRAWLNVKPTAAYALPDPIDVYSYSNGHLLSINEASVVSGWTIQNVNGNRPTFQPAPCLVSSTPGAELTIDFDGPTIGLWAVSGSDPIVDGAIDYKIDDGDWVIGYSMLKTKSLSLALPFSFILESELADGPHTLTLRVSNVIPTGSTGHLVRIAHFQEN